MAKSTRKIIRSGMTRKGGGLPIRSPSERTFARNNPNSATFKTSISPTTKAFRRHAHTWKKTKRFTSSNAGHKHKISLRRRLALPTGPDRHTHKLLRKKV